MCHRLGVLRTVDPVEADTFSMMIAQDFDGVAVEDRDDEAGEVGMGRGEYETQTGRQEDEEQSYSLT